MTMSALAERGAADNFIMYNYMQKRPDDDGRKDGFSSARRESVTNEE